MPWSKDHKDTTRGRILETASSALRAKGVAGVGVAQVMQEAGLTHGGFYAHFGSKEELVADAFSHACDQSAGKLEKVAEAAPAGARLNAVAAAYLSPNHARHPESGCPIAALGPELVRGEGRAREAFGERIRQRLGWMETLAPGKSKEERRRKAAGTYATMIGALLIARALGDADGDRYLAQVRRFLEEGEPAA